MTTDATNGMAQLRTQDLTIAETAEAISVWYAGSIETVLRDAIFAALQEVKRHEEAKAAEMSEAFIAAEIDRAPEPLRRLGEYLADLLDEDQWASANRMMLGAVEAVNRQSRNVEHWRQEVGKKASEIDRLSDNYKRTINELLAALKAVAPSGWLDDDVMEHMPGIKAARAAISKAEGA